MNNEEIALQAGLLARSLSDDCPCGHERRECFPHTAEALHSYGQTLVAQAYEKAAKAYCPLCSQGIPIHPHYENEISPYWHANENEEGLACGLEMPCIAARIRALKESLQPETVSS